MKFTIEVEKEGIGYSALGVVDNYDYHLYGSTLPACLRAVAHLVEDFGRQRTLKSELSMSNKTSYSEN